MNFDMEKFNKSVADHSYLISKGVRSMASMLIPKEEIDKAKNAATFYDVKLDIVNSTEDKYSIILFKEDYIKDIYYHLKLVKGPLRHWGLGHLFGYGLHEIDVFIKANNDLGEKE